MQIRLTVAAPRLDREPVDVVVTASRGTPLVTVADGLRAAAGVSRGRLYVGTTEVGEDACLGEPPLTEGALVSVEAPGPAEPQPPTGDGPAPVGLELRVVGGPDAGGVHLLTPGDVLIGRGTEADVRIDDPDVSRRHARLSVTPDGVSVQDMGSTNGGTLDGRPLSPEPAPFPPGAMLRIGESTVTLSTSAALVDAPPDGLGHRRLTRAPRERRHLMPVVVAAPEPPARSVSLLRLGRKAQRQAEEQYERDSAQTDAAIAKALAEEVQLRRESAMDAAELLMTALGPSRRLWQRRSDDEDALTVRLGIADLPSRVSVRIGDETRTPLAPGVPVTVSLPDVGVLGLAGPPRRRSGLARSVVAQIAGLHSPREVGLVLLATTEQAGSWAWARWLPHLRDCSGPEATLNVGIGPEQAAARVNELLAVVDGRKSALAEGRAREDDRLTVVVLDDTQSLASVAGLDRLLEEGHRVGVFAVCLAERLEELPKGCAAAAVFVGDVGTRLRLDVTGRVVVSDAVADLVSTAWAERLARGLAPLRDADPTDASETSGTGDTADVTTATEPARPQTLRLLDLLRLSPPHPDGIVARWTTGHREAMAVMGVGPGGLYRVDLRADGLIALYPGAGEVDEHGLLRTFLAGLAAEHRPDELAFILISDRDDEAFGACTRLPHALATITALSGNLGRRALASFEGELGRRDYLLQDAGVNDLDRYQELQQNDGRTSLPLARLVVAVSGFAALAKARPRVADGLADLARRGRSLGLHVVVTRTDAPAVPDPEPNRALAASGTGKPTAFRPATVNSPGGGRGPAVTTVDWRRRPAPDPRPAADAPPESRDAADGDAATSGLTMLVDAVREAAERLGGTLPPSPWLTPLPTIVTLDEIVRVDEDVVPLGLMDVPLSAARRPFSVDLAEDGHLIVVGGRGSGRSTVLRTFAGAVATYFDVGDVHLYGIDHDGALAPVAGLPHTGVIAGANEVPKAIGLVSRLLAEVEHRQELLRRTGYSTVAQQRDAALPEDRLPWIVLLLDSWERFVATYDRLESGRLIEELRQLLADGPAVGLRAVLTGGVDALASAPAPTVSQRLILRLPDAADCRIANLEEDQVPATTAPGRGVVPGTGNEVQVALLTEDPAAQLQAGALSELAGRASVRAEIRTRAPRPFRF